MTAAGVFWPPVTTGHHVRQISTSPGHDSWRPHLDRSKIETLGGVTLKFETRQKKKKRKEKQNFGWPKCRRLLALAICLPRSLTGTGNTISTVRSTEHE